MRAYVSPADIALRVCERLRTLVPDSAGHARAELQRVIADLHQLETQERRRLRTAVYVFAESPVPGEWYIGPQHDVRPKKGCGLGLTAGWQALAGHAPVCADFAEPGAKHPDDIVRKAVRVTTPAWLEEIGCEEIANEFRRMRVEGGRLYYRKAKNSPEIKTTYVFSMSAELPADRSKPDHGSSLTR